MDNWIKPFSKEAELLAIKVVEKVNVQNIKNHFLDNKENYPPEIVEDINQIKSIVVQDYPELAQLSIVDFYNDVILAVVNPNPRP